MASDRDSTRTELLPHEEVPSAPAAPLPSGIPPSPPQQRPTTPPRPNYTASPFGLFEDSRRISGVSPPRTDKCKRVIINMGSGRTKQGHRCTVECLQKYPIHHAARIGRYKDLKRLLEQYEKKCEEDPLSPGMCCPLKQDDCLGRTPLHYAACTGNVEKGLLCTKLLLECSALTVEPEKRTEKLRKFVNATDYNNETALHLAAKNEATYIVKELLLNQADLDITSYTGKCGLMEVYKKTPLAMNEALNQSIAYVELCRRELVDDEAADDPSKRKSSNNSDEIDFTHSFISVCMNFYPLLGSKVNKGRGKSGAPVPETSFLYEINRNRMESEVRRLMLNNVLVQAFLHFKWNKIKRFCFIAIFLHIVWLATYIGIVIDVYVVNCPFVTEDNEGEKVKGIDKMDLNKTNESGESGSSELVDEYYDGGGGRICRVNAVVHFASALLLLFSVGIALKELFQFIRLRSLYLRFENLGQCMLLTFIFISTPNLYMSRISVIDPLHYQISAFGIFLAWTLFLCQLAKLPRFCMRFAIFGWRVHVTLPDHGLYVEILSRVFKNFLVFISIFSSLLISFVFSFNILLPNSTGFINLSNSLLKVLTMMTGELNYDDIFHSEEEKLIYPVSSHVMYALFIMVATIILFNLLIGFTVSDIQGLQKDAEVNQISNKLEQIFLMECFLLSTAMQTMLRLACKLFGKGEAGRRELLSGIMVTRRTARHTFYCFHTPIRNLPTKLRVEIRDWASKNCLPKNELTGMHRSNIFQSSFTRH